MPEKPEHEGWSPADVTGVIANPFYAINIDPVLAAPHGTILSEDQWVQANARLINELGATAYLRNLLVILKGGSVTGAEQAPPGFRDTSEYEAADAGAHPHVHAVIEAGEMDGDITGQLLARMETEPGFLARCAAALDETLLDEDLAAELEELESDPGTLLSVLRASRTTWPELDAGAQRLIIIYAIDKVAIGPPSDSIDRQVRIRWRTGQP